MPGFTFPKLEALKNNYYELVNKLLEKHHILEVNLLPQHRQAQLARIEAALHEAEELDLKEFDSPTEWEQYQSAIVNDACRAIKAEITSEYKDGFTAAVLGVFSKELTDPKQSALFNLIEEVMGVTEENPLSIQYVVNTHNLHQEIKSIDKSKLAHVETTQYPWEDKDPVDQVKKEIKTFDKKNLKAPKVSEVSMFQNIAPQQDSDAPVANTTCKM